MGHPEIGLSETNILKKAVLGRTLDFKVSCAHKTCALQPHEKKREGWTPTCPATSLEDVPSAPPSQGEGRATEETTGCQANSLPRGPQRAREGSWRSIARGVVGTVWALSRLRLAAGLDWLAIWPPRQGRSLLLGGGHLRAYKVAGHEKQWRWALAKAALTGC